MEMTLGFGLLCERLIFIVYIIDDNARPTRDRLLESAMLFYKKLVKDLTAYGFEINPYDPYVANKIVNGE
jgi:hypothetical protein